MIKIYALFGDTGSSPFKLDGAGARAALASRLPNLAGYRQFQRTADQFEGLTKAPYQASAELWLSEGDDAGAVLDALRAAAATLPAVFSRDPEQLIQSTEHNISGEPGRDSGFKATFLFDRKPGMALEAFHAYWLNHHGPIAAQTQDAERYVQSHVTDPRRRWDGITELFWRDYPTALASMASEQMRVDQSTDAQNFVDGSSLVVFLGQES